MITFSIPFRKRKARSKPPAAEPAPPAPVSVTAVEPIDGFGVVALWVFSKPIEDPVDAELPDLAMNGQPGMGWERHDAASLRVEYFNPPEVGQPWSNAAGAGGIVASDGGALEEGDGVVSE